MAGYCTSCILCTRVQYPAISYCLLDHQIIDVLVPSTSCAHVCFKAWIFKKLQAVGLFLALDGACIPIPLLVEKGTVSNNAVFICNESLFLVSAVATSAFQLKHKPGCYAAYGSQEAVPPPPSPPSKFLHFLKFNLKPFCNSLLLRQDSPSVPPTSYMKFCTEMNTMMIAEGTTPTQSQGLIHIVTFHPNK